MGFTSILCYLQTGFIRRLQQIKQHEAAELVFHLTEETAADCDRLRRGGIVLIEINIVIFLCWYISWRPSNIGQTRLDPSRVHADKIEVMVAPTRGGAQWIPEPREIFGNIKLHQLCSISCDLWPHCCIIGVHKFCRCSCSLFATDIEPHQLTYCHGPV